MKEQLQAAAAQVADGDAAAFRQIVVATQAPLYRLAGRLMGDLAEAEDALQEAYAKVFQALQAEKYDGRSALLTWMYPIVYRTCLDLRRKRKELPTAERAPAQFDGNVLTEAAEQRRSVMKDCVPALDALREQTDVRIKKELGPAQRAKHDKMMQRMRRHRKGRHGQGHHRVSGPNH